MFTKASTDSSRLLTDNFEKKYHLKGSLSKLPLKQLIQTNTDISRQSTEPSGYIYLTQENNTEENQKRTGPNNQRANIEIRDMVTKRDIHFVNQAEGKLKCYCNVCTVQNKYRPEPEEVPRDPFFDDLDFSSNDQCQTYEKDFTFVLKYLMPTKHTSSHTLRLRIPETVIFINGQPKFFVLQNKVK